MATDINAWHDEHLRLAKAATPGPWRADERWVFNGLLDINVADVGKETGATTAQHIAAWSPAQVERVLAVVRAAAAIADDPHCLMRSMGYQGETFDSKSPEWIALRAALAALAGDKP